MLFTNGFSQNNAIGIGIKWAGSLRWPNISKTISTPQRLGPYAAELVALDTAVSHILASIQGGGTGPPITVFSDCKSALQALNNPYPKSGQFLITQITLKVHEINMSQRSQVSFQWSPGHSEIPGNEQAHKLAQDATTVIPVHVDDPPLYPLLQSVALDEGRRLYLAPPPPWVKPPTGKFTHRIDKALPGKHTETLYKGRSKVEAGVLCQLRSGMCRLNGYLAKIGAAEWSMCECGRESESVDHFLFRCPQWLEQRESLFKLARKANRWGDLSFALGGWSSERKDGSPQSWKPTQEMVSATIKFAMATNRLSDKREESEREPRAEGFADDVETCTDEQVPHAEEDLSA